MRTVLAPFAWTWRKVERLRALVSDEDHDDWNDSHGDHARKVNHEIVGPGGTGG